jgi:hypothetical protein
MAQSPSFALANTFLPNLVKLKGAATVVSSIERREKVFFDQVWNQAHITHNPNLLSQGRDPYRIGVIGLPAPKEMGEAHMVAVVVKIGDPQFSRYFMLEHDYVLAKKADRTVVCEREGSKHTKHFEGPVLTGDLAKDGVAFIDAFMELIVSTKVTKQ